MAMNPKMLFQAKERYNICKKQHTKLLEFGKVLDENAVEAGTVFEITATTPEGKKYTANIRLTPEDVETFRMFHKQQG